MNSAHSPNSSPQGNDWWTDDLREVCVQFQLDLSCLVDGELDEKAAGRAIAHLEDCSTCTSFFTDVRDQVRAHRELSDSEGLIRQYASLVGAHFDESLERIELIHRLSTIFYQLGKAYVLTALDPDFRTRVFEKIMAVGPLKNRGRGFVDGILESGRDVSGVDLRSARHMLNGHLSEIENPLEKGKRLLQEALAVDPAHEEARFYQAYVDAHEGRRMRAAQAYRQLFRTAVDVANRAHAAVQLGRMFNEEGEKKKAIACNRWVVMSGLADLDDRFFFVRFNIGMYYADLRRPEKSLAAFRALLDRQPEKIEEVARLFVHAPRMRAVIDAQPGFGEKLLETCPELFAPQADLDADDSDPDRKGSEEIG